MAFTQLGPDIDGEASGDYSGKSVSLSSDGSVVAIGAYTNDGNGKVVSGHTRIYQWDSASSSWNQLGSDIDGEAVSDRSGHSVSLSSDGSIVAIGAHRNGANGEDSGHTRIYQWNSASSSWNQLGSDIDGEAALDYSGYSVSLSSDGSIVAIGAHRNDGNGNNSGHTRIYKWNGSSWNKLGSDIDGEAANDSSGYSVSLSSDGSTVAIGATSNDGNGNSSGHTRIYQWDSASSSWNQLGSDIDGEAKDNSSGVSVSLSSDGSIVAIGAPSNNGSSAKSGHVRIYQWNSASSSWNQLGSDIDGEAAYDGSGHSVSLSSDGSFVAIGAGGNDANGNGSGHTRIYQWDSASSSWNQLGSDIDGEAALDASGRSVSLSSDGSFVAIGARGNDGNGSNSGHVRVFSLRPTVQSVSSSTADGTYKAGDVITINVVFSEAVTVTTTGGTPQLTLETGSTDQNASYSSGSGTTTLAFSYTVQAGDTASDLNYKATSSLALNGGTIKEAAGNNATLTLPSLAGSDSLAGSSALVIDGAAPTIAISSDVASLKAGETATLTFTLSEASSNFAESDVTVSGGTLSNWSAASATSYSATFTPTADSTTNGVISVASSKFSDSAGNTNNDGSDSNNTVTLSVDTGRPTIAVSSDVASLKAGETATLTFTLSEASSNFAESDVTVSGGTLSNWSAASATSYSATFTPTADSTTDGVISVASSKFSDSAGNTNNDGSDSNNTVTLTVDTGINIDVAPKTNPPSGFNEFIETGQIKVDQPSTTFTTDSLINFRELQPTGIVTNYDSLLGEGGGGQTLRSKTDGGISQEKGVLILANSFCSSVDDSIIQHKASTGDAFFVVLTAAPTSNLTVTLNSPNDFQGIFSQEKLVFTPENWDIPQTVFFTADLLGKVGNAQSLKITATSDKEGGYSGSEQDSAIFSINKTVNSVQQISTRDKRPDNHLYKNPINLDIERLAAHDELSPLFTILRIISFPAVAIILAIKSVKSFQSKPTSSGHSINQKDSEHASHTLQIEPFAISSFNGIRDQSDFHRADINQYLSGDIHTYGSSQVKNLGCCLFAFEDDTQMSTSDYDFNDLTAKFQIIT
ncbi:Ig-like domain-containing protein [Synechococcus sp. MIT S9508]|uniref:Ig-like domain-containing protein n=1 Tax=Synechococcus sp. MIT S9508 TaxID=1801629 RepID=UPI0007BB5F4A|nr:Ig-like domain-containing protein [Synechococcus sp. MIT S9508]KZR87532.1 PFU (PLAA family ubiquitin binding) [Synechococcus sp. MIT S9508]